MDSLIHKHFIHPNPVIVPAPTGWGGSDIDLCAVLLEGLEASGEALYTTSNRMIRENFRKYRQAVKVIPAPSLSLIWASPSCVPVPSGTRCSFPDTPTHWPHPTWPVLTSEGECPAVREPRAVYQHHHMAERPHEGGTKSPSLAIRLSQSTALGPWTPSVRRTTSSGYWAGFSFQFLLFSPLHYK